MEMDRAYLRDCLNIADLDLLLPGGENYYNFVVLGKDDRSLECFASIEWDESDMNSHVYDIDQIYEIGFLIETITADTLDQEEAPISYFELILSEPVVLSEPCHISPEKAS